MVRLRLVLGAVGKDSVRGLVLCDDPGGVPALTLAGPDASAATVRIAQAPDSEATRAFAPVRVFPFECAGLQVGSSYDVSAQLTGGPIVASRFTTLNPGATSLSIAVASCYYDFFHYGSKYRAALDAHARHCAFKLLVGDNLYLDIHSRQRDDALNGGYLETAWVYKQYFWESDGYADVLRTLPTFTTWDDHEFWNNFPEEQKWLSRSKPPDRTKYIEAGRAFVDLLQATLNPPPVAGTRSYRIPDTPLVDIFVGDVRTDRTMYSLAAAMIPEAALADLEAWAAGLERPGILVLGQPLVIDRGAKTDWNPPAFATQWNRIWKALERARFDILVLSGDVHHSRVLELQLSNGRAVYEIVTSPASHIPTIKSTITGSYSGQGYDNVEFPERVAHSDGSAEVRRYMFGTDSPNSIAVLSLAGGGGTVHVGCRFIDLDTCAAPRATRANRGTFKSGLSPFHQVCDVSHLFSLKQRG